MFGLVKVAGAHIDLQQMLLAGARGDALLAGDQGMRASIYNAMPLAGVEALVGYMREFEKKRASSQATECISETIACSVLSRSPGRT